MGNKDVHVLRGIDLLVSKGDFLSIMGPSGSGKSTLLHILGCLDRPAYGEYLLDGRNMFAGSDRELSRFRAEHIGFVFQSFHLLPMLNVFENVALPFQYSGSVSLREQKRRVKEVIRQVGLENRMLHKPAELSGGEMQRTAIARAIVMNPGILLADEPTGNLDSETGEHILEIFKKYNHAGGTVIMITHDREVAAHARSCMYIKDGTIAVPSV
jgi:putative ABC transport system ATP-binding protein